jgi:hypothetical protein
MWDFRLLLQCTWAQTSKSFNCIIGHGLASRIWTATWTIAATDITGSDGEFWVTVIKLLLQLCYSFLYTHFFRPIIHFVLTICVMLQLQNTFFLHKFPLCSLEFRVCSNYSVSCDDSRIFGQINIKRHGCFSVFKSVSIHVLHVSKRSGKLQIFTFYI